MTVIPYKNPEQVERLEQLMARRILVLDGAMGTMIQARALDEEDFRSERLAGHRKPLKGNNDLLSLTRPDVILDIHRSFLEAGADFVETNTFNATSISQADYDTVELVRELNRASARLARTAVDDQMAAEPDRECFVLGALGPTNRTASLSPDVNRPDYRNITFDQLRTAYAEAALGLIEGGSDLLIVETVFDTLNCKAALFGIAESTGLPAAGHHLRNHRRRQRQDAVGPDGRSLLELDPTQPSVRRRPELRTGRDRNPALAQGTGPGCRLPGKPLPERGFAQ